MDTMNTENHLVVKRPDGTLATRMVASLPSSPNTTRTLQSDLLLTSALCNCPSLPLAMIQSLLDNGYSNQNLLDFQIPIEDLLAAGVSIQDLITAGVSIQDLITAGVSIQELLAAGQTPIVLFNAGVVLDSLYGKTFEGGLIFYLDTSTGEGFVAAPADQSTGAEWGCFGTDIPGADGIVIGTGSQNTTDIVNGCPTSGIAARICDELILNGKTDWFLPSKDELDLMWENLADSDGNGTNNGTSDPGNLGGFAAHFYWSSTEGDSFNAWYQYFFNGFQYIAHKVNNNRVRAARAF